MFKITIRTFLILIVLLTLVVISFGQLSFKTFQRLRVYDGSYTPFLTPTTNFFTVGSDNTITVATANHFAGQENQFILNTSGTSKNYMGILNRMNFNTGSPASPTVMGIWSTLVSNGFAPTGTSRMYAVRGDIDVGWPASEAYGGHFQAVHGSSAADGAGKLVGIRAIVGGGHNGNLTSAYGGEFRYSTSSSSPLSTTASAIGVGIQGTFQNNTATTVFKGLAIQDFDITGGGTVGTSYGIYIDATSDVGTTKWAFYSDAKAPSKFSGTVSLAPGGPVTSSATISITGNLFHVTGTNNIMSISGTGIVSGTCITAIFDGILTLTDGSNLKMAGDFVTSADDTWSGCYDGTNWYEISRAIN